MPGITGIISKKPGGGENVKVQLERMVSCMLHENFYAHGTYINRELGVYIGYVSLKDSFSDCMPIRNETSDCILFITGECYFDQSDIDGLKHRGHCFNEETAEIIIHLYEELGNKVFEKLNGWFSGFLIDLRTKEATLFNDRCGTRRIYYYEARDAFYFGSEAKSLLSVVPALRQLDQRSIGEFIVYDCVMEGRTYFRDMFLLPSGSAWCFNAGHVAKKTYHDPSYLENLTQLRPNDFFDEFATTFSKILPRYFRGKKIGISLTGGLDTRSIMACIGGKPGTLPCYTFGGKFKDIFDVRIAPSVALDCGQPHTVLRMDDAEFLRTYPEELEKAIWITDGIVPVDMVDMLNFNRMARGIAQIRMTGKYGSQVLKNIAAFKDRSPVPGLVASSFEPFLAMARETAQTALLTRSFTFMLMNEIPWWWNGMLSVESSQVEVRSPFLDNDLIEVIYRGQGQNINTGADLQLKLIAKLKPSLMAIPTTGTYGGNTPIISALRKEIIKTLMIADKLYIRERLPFSLTHVMARLDHLLIKPLGLDKLLFGHVDFRRYRSWYRDELSGYLKETLLSSRMKERPYWLFDKVDNCISDHIKGRGMYLREIRKVLQIEMIHKVLVERYS